MSRVKLRGVDLSRTTADIRAETGASYQAIAVARKRAGVPPTHPEKSRLNPGRSRRVKVQRAEKLVSAAPVAVPVVEVAVPVGPRLCRPRSEEEWEREPVVRRTDR